MPRRGQCELELKSSGETEAIYATENAYTSPMKCGIPPRENGEVCRGVVCYKADVGKAAKKGLAERMEDGIKLSRLLVPDPSRAHGKGGKRVSFKAGNSKSARLGDSRVAVKERHAEGRRHNTTNEGREGRVAYKKQRAPYCVGEGKGLKSYATRHGWKP